ncbi:MAG: hypothetical protein AB7G11_10985 [Phycisphaerales bacterium]
MSEPVNDPTVRGATYQPDEVWLYAEPTEPGQPKHPLAEYRVIKQAGNYVFVRRWLAVVGQWMSAKQWVDGTANRVGRARVVLGVWVSTDYSGGGSQ